MAIADKLTKLATDITNAYDAIDDKGGTLPANKNTNNLENAIRSIQTGVTPTGTKQISITQNGTTTEDVTNYANAQITTNVVNQDYEDALVAFGVTEDLADSIEALTTYSNEVTGESDTTLSDAVRTLTDGYGGGEPDYDDVTLPAEYQRVEYIESTGSQYIDLPFGFDPTDEICSVLLVPTGTTSENWLVAPQRWNTNNNRFCFAGVQGAHYGIGYGRAGTNGTVLQYYYANDGAFHKHTYKDYLFAIKEVNTYLGGVNRIDFGGTTANLRLFYGYNSGTAGKIRYYVHKKEDDTGVALYACYRKADGVIGMYDVDNDIFYTNDGSGTFEKGGDI